MNFTGYKNYLIAVVISLTFHILLLIIYLPESPALQNNPRLETFPVGLVEIASGSMGVMLSLPKNKPKISMILKNPGIKQQDKRNTVIMPKVSPNQPPKDAIVLPKKEGNTLADNSAEKPVNQSTPSGNTDAIINSINPETNRPQSFGTGEGMISILGPMPIYPKSALSEGKQGDVAVRILVNADGNLKLVIITDSSGDLRLDYAATSSIEGIWKFKSVTKDYYIDLVFSFNVKTGVTVKFLNSETRPQPH